MMNKMSNTPPEAKTGVAEPHITEQSPVVATALCIAANTAYAVVETTRICIRKRNRLL